MVGKLEHKRIKKNQLKQLRRGNQILEKNQYSTLSLKSRENFDKDNQNGLIPGKIRTNGLK